MASQHRWRVGRTTSELPATRVSSTYRIQHDVIRALRATRRYINTLAISCALHNTHDPHFRIQPLFTNLTTTLNTNHNGACGNVSITREVNAKFKFLSKQGTIVSAIAGAIGAVVSAIASIIMIIVSVIATVSNFDAYIKCKVS